MFRFLWRIAREALALHLLLPLVGSILVGSFVAYLRGTALRALPAYWLEHSAELVTVYVVFIAVLVNLARRETGIRVTNLATLDDELPGSEGYFALAAIPLREWFDPSVQVYLARLFAHQAATPGFRHDRVVLFLTRGSFLDVHSSFLDEYHARCLSKLHRQFGAELAFLRPEKLFELLDGLTPEDKAALGYSKTARFIRRVKIPWTTKRLVDSLAFAEIRAAGGSKCVVVFFKAPGELSVRSIKDKVPMRPYENLLERVRETIYLPGTSTLRAEYSFAKHLEL